MSGQPVEGTEFGGGRYILEGKLGRGGAATVWLARDTVLERPVAVKVLAEALASDPSWLARFRREARLAASLSHPNLVSVYDFDAGEPPYIVMAHMSGGSLYERIEASECPVAEDLAHDLLSALDAIHAAGIIHRDIKPGNVLFAADDTACLTDFGVARPEDATQLTQTGHIPGTGRYMAPELWKGQPADERSDLYAAGILLRQAVGAHASPELHALIGALTADDPRDRPASAAEALSRLPDSGPPAPPAWEDPPPEDPTPPTLVTPTRSQPSRGLALAGLAALAVVVAIALSQALGGEDGESNGGSGSNAAGAANEDNSGTGEGNPGSSESSGSSGSGEEEEVAPVEEAVDPVALDQEGKALIDAGDPESAIPVLQQAVDSYPEDSRDINYAYSLYNLGNALLLAGRPDEAIPYLEERLTFDDQTETVQATLDAAREASGKPEKGPKPPKED